MCRVGHLDGRPRIDQPVDQLRVPGSRRDHEGRPSLRVRHLGIGPGKEQGVGGGEVAVLDGDHHGGRGARRRRAHARPALQQRLDHLHRPDLRRPLQRRPTLRVGALDVGARREEGARGVELGRLRGDHEGRATVAGHARVHVRLRIQKRLDWAGVAGLCRVHERRPLPHKAAGGRARTLRAERREQRRHQLPAALRRLQRGDEERRTLFGRRLGTMLQEEGGDRHVAPGERLAQQRRRRGRRFGREPSSTLQQRRHLGRVALDHRQLERSIRHRHIA